MHVPRYFIVNDQASLAGQARDALLDLAGRFSCHVWSTADNERTEWALRQAKQRGGRLVIAGGDGTASWVVRHLAPEFPPMELAVLPLGTGNDLARSLDIRLTTLPDTLDYLLTAPAQPVDVVRVNDGSQSYFINAATGGFGGEVTAHLRGEAKRVWGAFSYWLTAVSQLPHAKEYDVDVWFDDQHQEICVHGLTVANGRYVGGGFTMAPAALLNDGWIDVTVIPVSPKLELLSAGLNLMLGRTELSQPLTTHPARRVQLRAQPEMWFSLDGEAQCALEATFEICSGAVLLVAGPQAALAASQSAAPALKVSRI